MGVLEGFWRIPLDLDVSENSGTPKSSIFIGFSIINLPFWGYPYFWKHPFLDKTLRFLDDGVDQDFC